MSFTTGPPRVYLDGKEIPGVKEVTIKNGFDSYEMAIFSEDPLLAEISRVEARERVRQIIAKFTKGKS